MIYHQTRRVAFTLLELMVVISLIGLLFGMVLPAVQSAREAARNSLCKNNLRQVGLGMANHECAHRRYPSSSKPPCNSSTAAQQVGWSAFGQILPHMEQNTLYSQIDFSVSYNAAAPILAADGSSIEIPALRIPTYMCPSEAQNTAKIQNGGVAEYPINYAVNLGPWLVFDAAKSKGGAGAFYPGSKLGSVDFKDGLSFTLCVAEVKAFQPGYSNATIATDPGAPTSVPSLNANIAGAAVVDFMGHAAWADGKARQTGFTSTFRPNLNVAYQDLGTGAMYDIDFTTASEVVLPVGMNSTALPTWAAITSRSYHAGLVNAVLMDGSVHSFENDTDIRVWQALSTRGGSDFVPDFQTP